MSHRIVATRLALAALVGGILSTPALACPPQLTVERPGSGSAPDSTFVLIHASRGCQSGKLTVTGTAEGLIAGARRSIPLEMVATGTEGLYLVRRQWPREGVWVLHLVARVGEGSSAALVGVNASGEIVTVRQQDPSRRVYPTLTDVDVERMLRSLAR